MTVSPPSSLSTDESGSGQLEGMDMVVCRAPGGEFYVEGETWNLDECTRCTCRKGRVLCDTEVCPPAVCQTPIRNKDTCCHVCPGNKTRERRPGGKYEAVYGVLSARSSRRFLRVAPRWQVLCPANRLIKKPAETSWVYTVTLQAAAHVACFHPAAHSGCPP